MSNKPEKHLSRRDFLKTSAIITTATGGVLAGCQPKAAPTEAPAPEPTAAPQAASPVVPNYTTPPASIDSYEIKDTFDTEIVIIGAGLSGISAAASASELGGKVIVLEKRDSFSYRGGDLGAVNTHVQKEDGVEIDVNEACLEFMKVSGNKPDQRFIRMWAEKSGEAFDWFTGIAATKDVKFHVTQWPEPEPYDNKTEYYKQYHSVHEAEDWFGDWPIAIGAVMEVAEQNGAEFRFETKAIQLIRSDERVTGVIAQDADGNYLQFNASKAIVLSTGDYGHNTEMMQDFCPQAAELAKIVNIYDGDNFGEGHMMGMWVGAQMERAPHAPMSHGFSGPLGCDSYLQVNILGERFQNEDIPGQSWTNQVERQPKGIAWQVFDSKYPEQLEYMPVGHGGITSITPPIQANFDQAITYQAWKDGATLPMSAGPFGAIPGVADTIDEMAEMMEVPPDALKATIDRYNELCNLGEDLDFGKRSDRMFPIENPPYYFGRGGFAFLVVMGGLITNSNFQPLDENYKPIPGLYANGNVVGQRFAGDYPTTCPGVSHGMALTFGRLIGQHIVTEEA